MPTRPLHALKRTTYVGMFKLEKPTGPIVVKDTDLILYCAVCKNKYWYGSGYKVFAWQSWSRDDGFYYLTADVCSETCYNMFCLEQI